MTSIEPDLPGWSGTLVLTQAQVDTIKADLDVADAWRALPLDVNAWVDYLGQHEVGGQTVYRASHPSLTWEVAELLLEVCDSSTARNELLVERAKGGSWQPRARSRVQTLVNKKSTADRAKTLADNESRVSPVSPLRG